ILSVGIAILAPDGERVYRGSTVVVGASERVGSDPREAAPRGWVDLRPEQFGLWIARAREMLAQAERRRNRAADSGSDVDWTALGTVEWKIGATGLHWHGQQLLPRNSQIAELAGLLYARGVRVITLNPGMTADHVLALFGVAVGTMQPDDAALGRIALALGRR